MSKTKEEFVKEVVNISEKMEDAKNEFATALYKYEKDVSALTNVAQSLLWEAENCGLKCELT